MGFNLVVWMFIIYGFIVHLSGTLYAVWAVFALLWCVGHPIELSKSIPIGKKAGVPLPIIIIKTILFGMTWWKPLSLGILNK